MNELPYDVIADMARRMRNALIHNSRFSHDEAIKLVAASMPAIIEQARG